MSASNFIDGIIRPTSPLHCASPDKSLARETSETPTVQMRIVTNRGERRIPYFPGNDLRGRLRRKAAAIVLEHITASGKVSPQLYMGLCAGAMSAQPDSSDLTIEEALRAGSNVYMGLFGGGARMIRSRYAVQDLIPVLEETVEIGMVPRRFIEMTDQSFLPMRQTIDGERPLESWSTVQTRQVIRIDDVMRVTRPSEIEQFVRDAAAEVSAAQADVLSSRLRRKEGKAAAEAGAIKASAIAKKTDIGTVSALQFISPGTPMHFRMDFFDETSDAQVGLMLLALRELVVEQRLGGWCRAGAGRFSASLTLTRNGESMPIFDDMPTAVEARLSAAVASFVDCAHGEIAGLSAESLMEFFVNRATDTKAAA